MGLAAALLFAGVGCFSISGSDRYANADRYAAGAMSYRADQVRAVVIDWAAGNVTLKHGGDVLNVSESGGDALDEKDRLHWWIDGTTLRIHYCASGRVTTANKEQKHLTVELPDFVDLDVDAASGRVLSEDTLNLGKFRLDTASGGADIYGLFAKEAEIDSASGALSFGTVSVTGSFTVDTASGALTIEHISANRIEAESSSGHVSIGLDSAEKVVIDTASGNVLLKLSDPVSGARVRVDTASGRFTSTLLHRSDGKDDVFGLGAIPVRIDTASGNISIE